LDTPYSYYFSMFSFMKNCYDEIMNAQTILNVLIKSPKYSLPNPLSITADLS
jgi:hypothetical protein